jgi:GT2 family glycosyltransferase
MPAAIVVIPACNEAERLGFCLGALARQDRLPDRVFLLLNNCTDRSEDVVQSIAHTLPFPLHVAVTDLIAEKRGAGHARRLAMSMAAAEAGPDDILMTTDADGVVPQSWVRRNLQHIGAGLDVVCGQAVIDPVDAGAIPQHLHDDDELECELLGLLDEFAWILDPEPHDPFPRHMEASGASLAVTMAAFQRVGGMPDMASSEDRAFVRALWLLDARIRHEPTIRVTVSGRITGRAGGGMAETIRRRIVQQDEYTDAQVEPAANAFRRYQLRGAFRKIWQGRSHSASLEAALGISPSILKRAITGRYFGSGWALLEGASQVLQRQPVKFRDLRREIAGAKSLLSDARQVACSTVC